MTAPAPNLGAWEAPFLPQFPRSPLRAGLSLWDAARFLPGGWAVGGIGRQQLLFCLSHPPGRVRRAPAASRSLCVQGLLALERQE